MINTTTIPTTATSGNDFMQVMWIIGLGLLFGASMVEFVLHRIKEHAIDDLTVEPKDKKTDYTRKYSEEFRSLKKRDLSEDELTKLGSKCVMETLPNGNIEVIMTYDKKTESFWYYTDHLKEVSYASLETIARKFAIDFDCKAICVYDASEAEASASASEAAESASASEAEASASEADAEAESASEAEAESTSEAESESTSEAEESASASEAEAPKQTKPLFATFKKYNTGYKGANSNFPSPVSVVEQSNHFRFRGKIGDYNEEKIEKVSIEPTLDYSTYKKLLLEKKVN